MPQKSTPKIVHKKVHKKVPKKVQGLLKVPKKVPKIVHFLKKVPKIALLRALFVVQTLYAISHTFSESPGHALRHSAILDGS